MATLPQSIKTVIQEISNGSICRSQLAENSLQRIKDLKHLNAFTFVKSTKQLSQNYEGDKNMPRKTGSLEGIPIAVKDNFCVENMPATCGSKMLYGFKPPYTATVVRKLEEAGAIIMGKTNMDEFGMGNGTVDSIFGPTKNIWGLEKFRYSSLSFDDWHVPGGSSGGSAVAVASGMCIGALGSDTGGSTRNPASYCGVYGLKPTYGTVSRHGLIPLVNSMDVPGILSRSVDDCATIFDVIKGWDEMDSTTVKNKRSDLAFTTVPSDEGHIKGVRIGMPKEYQCEGMSPEVIKLWQEIANILENEGASIREISLPHTKYSIVCYSVLNPAEVASNMARYDGLRYGHRSQKKDLNSTESLYAQTRHEGFNSVVRGRILAGNYFLLKSNYEKYFQQAMKIRRLITEDFEKAWNQNENSADGVDLILTPVTLTSAPKYSEFIEWDNRKQSSVQDFCTQSANMAGLPALSIPIKLSENEKMPLSLQLIGPRFSERVIFEVAKRIENLVNFSQFYSLFNKLK